MNYNYKIEYRPQINRYRVTFLGRSDELDFVPVEHELDFKTADEAELYCKKYTGKLKKGGKNIAAYIFTVPVDVEPTPVVEEPTP
jgi:hypothetical protein